MLIVNPEMELVLETQFNKIKLMRQLALYSAVDFERNLGISISKHSWI